MPFYEYQCQACGAQVEVMQKITDAPLKKCPECGKSRLVKLVSAPVFRLKGGGWYETDFKTDKDKRKRLVDGGAEPAPAAEAAPAGKDAKPEQPAKPDKPEKPARPDKAEKAAARPAGPARAKKAAGGKGA